MKRNLFVLMMFLAASLLMACGDTGAGNNATGSRPANSSTNVANAAAPAADPKAAEADVRKMLDNIQTALSKNDADAMDKIYADNYMIVNLDGSVQNKAERIAALRSGEVKYSLFEHSEQNVRVNADGNSAVSLTKLTMKGTLKGKPMDGVYRVTGVWSKAKDGWKLMSASTTKMDGSAAKTDDKAKAGDKPNTNQVPKKMGDPKVDAQVAD